MPSAPAGDSRFSDKRKRTPFARRQK